MKFSHPIFTVTAALLLFVTASRVQAIQIGFALDPSSNLTLAVNFSGIASGEQGPGSLMTTYSGTLTVNVDNLLAPASIDFLSSEVVAANSGNWLPEVGGGTIGGSPGAAEPANYGGFAAPGLPPMVTLTPRYEIGISMRPLPAELLP
ncbi:MAG: hypothetical protein ABGX16_05015 [Pirellulales bacterium]